MTEAQLLAELPDWAFAFVLVLCRCSMAVMLLPGIGEAELPAVVRAGVALGLTALVLPGVGIVAEPGGAWHAIGMVSAELFCGALLGWLARLPVLALSMTGQVISYMLGLSNVVQLDVTLGQSSALMRLLSLVAPLLVLGTGMWMLPVAALGGSYTLVPPGHLLPVTDSAQAVIDAVATSCGLGIQVAAPFIFATIIWQMALGLMSRLIPHLQIYFAAVPGQIIGGLALLGLLAGGMLDAWSETVRSSLGALPGL